MTYEVLARKWRPQVFEDVIGQEHVTQTLINAVRTDRLAHAYVFSGPRGVGKTSVARILAKALNCEQGEPGIPCNKCVSCVEITDGSSGDVQEIDGASNRGIDDIRELRENVKYMPASSKYRIYIVDEVHMLTIPAFNALLKTLEEPPPHVKFIFATTEPHKMPVTILSRCQRFDFKRIPLGEIVSHLERITKEEDIEISSSSMALIAKEAEGSMRDAESLLDQVVSFTGQKVEDKHVMDILGVIDRGIVFEASAAIIEGSAKKCLEIAERIYNYGYDIKEFYRSIMDQIRNLLISLVADQDYLLDMSKIEKAEVRMQAEKVGSEKLHILLNFMINREQVLRSTTHPRLILEATMMTLCHLGDFLSFGDLLERIEFLEKRLVSALATKEQSKAGHISDPGKRWASDDHEKDQRENNIPFENGKSWDDFLTFLSTKNKVIFNVLKDWKISKLTKNTIEIAKGNQSFSSSYFDNKEQYDQLTNYSRDFFQRDIRIKITADKQPLLQTNPSTKEVPDLPAPVQDILQMFQGKIKE